MLCHQALLELSSIKISFNSLLSNSGRSALSVRNNARLKIDNDDTGRFTAVDVGF